MTAVGRAAMAVAAVAAFAACSGSDTSQPAETTPSPNASVPVLVPPAATVPSADTEAPPSGVRTLDIVTRSADAVGDGVQPEGFTTVTALVTSADGEVCEICLWLADDPDESGRGLMGVTDLGGPVGMAFVYDAPRDGAFFMFQTPTPLSIAWFSASGEYIAQADMDPCLVENSAVCERYRPGGEYTIAVEMFAGQFGQVGIGPGSSIELLDVPCA